MTPIQSRFATLASTTLLLSSLALLSACGGGSSGTAATDTSGTTDSPITTGDDNVNPVKPITTGVFIDAPVKGLAYKTATQSGVTNDKGEFKYIMGETVTFSLDGVELGSAKAQAKLPVTLISTEGYVAQFLQTMDTDANPELIDVTGIRIEPNAPSSSRYREYLKTILQYGVLRWGSGTFDGNYQLRDYLSLSKIQTDSQVALFNQTVVTEEAAAKHVYNAVGSTPWQTSEVSGKVFAKADVAGSKEIFMFHSNGTLLAYAQDFGENTPETMQGTWLLQNGQLLVTFTGEAIQYKVHKISQDDNTIDFWPESTSTESDGLNEWHPAQPLTLAALNGKHLSFDMTGTSCTAMTMSFSGTTATLRDKCAGQYSEAVGTAENVAGTTNLIKFSVGTKSMLLALASGDLTKGRMVRANVSGSTLGSLDANDITAVSTPLQP